MEQTPEGTPVGVDDPYAVAGLCDHLTDDGRCRFALNHGSVDPEFAEQRAVDGYTCHVGEAGDWRACPHYRWTTTNDECRRCGLRGRRLAHDDSRPLIEEHHLSYADADAGDGAATADSDTVDASHELTVALCRWCHAKVHQAFARIDDGVDPDPEAIAEREQRRAAENEEVEFQSARDRFED